MTPQCDILVAFDLDDTLYKEKNYVESGYNYVLNRVAGMLGCSVEVLKSNLLSQYPGLHTFDAIENYTHRQLCVAQLVDIYRNHLPSIVLPDESREVLKWLKKGGYRLALITDGRHFGQWNKINALGLLEYFPKDNIIISDDAGGDKTTLKPWLRAEQLSEGCQHRVYIGDNPAKDFYIPNTHGWDTVLLIDDGRNVAPQDIVLPGPLYAAKHKVKTLADIPALLQEL